MNVMTASSAAAAAAGQPIVPASALFHAAGRLLPDLERGRAVDARRLREAMEQAFGGTDAEGAWSWKDAYEARSEEHTSELQSLMRISYAVFCLKKKKKSPRSTIIYTN